MADCSTATTSRMCAYTTRVPEYPGRNASTSERCSTAKGKKQDQIIVIYEPWAEEMRKLALRAQALSWDMGKLNREVARMAFLFPEIPEEDKERYMFRTTLHHIPGVGYKPIDPQTIRDWLTNEMLIGWWQPDADKPDTIINNHPAVLDYALFAEGYAALKGYTLEGEQVDNWGGITRIRKTRETPPRPAVSRQAHRRAALA